MIGSNDSNLKTRVLLLSAAITAVVVLSAAGIFGLSLPTTIQQAEAHSDPLACGLTGVTNAEGVTRSTSTPGANGVIPPTVGAGDLVDGEAVEYFAVLTSDPFCAFQDGVHKITKPDLAQVITHDDGVSTGTSGGVIGIAIPCIDGSLVDASGPDCDSTNDYFLTDTAPYTVDCDDESNGLLLSVTTYTGLAHNSPTNTANGAGGQGSQNNPCLVPNINITKTVTPTISKVGDNVTYTVTICNNGETYDANIVVLDSIKGDLSANFVDYLAPDTCDTFIYEHQITGSEPGATANTLPNEANVTANAALDADVDGIIDAAGIDLVFDGVDTVDGVLATTDIPVFAKDPALVTLLHPSFDFTKECLDVNGVLIGEPAHFKISFKNTGDVDLIVNITDSDVDSPISVLNQPVAQGAFYNITNIAKTNASATDFITNVADVTVRLGGAGAHLPNEYQRQSNDGDPARCPVFGEPDIRLEKIANVTIVAIDADPNTSTPPSAKVKYTFNATNNGTVTLTDVKLDENQTGVVATDYVGHTNVKVTLGAINQLCESAISGPFEGDLTTLNSTMAPGESRFFICEITVTLGDLPTCQEDDGLINGATASGKFGEQVVTDEDGAIVDCMGINLEKTVNITTIQFGSTNTDPVTVKYTFTVTNLGNVPLNITQATGANITEYAEGTEVTMDNGNAVTPNELCLTPIVFEGGDTNGDGLLDPDETWTLTCETEISPDECDEDQVNAAQVIGRDASGELFVGSSDDATVTCSVEEPRMNGGGRVNPSTQTLNKNDGSPIDPDSPFVPTNWPDLTGKRSANQYILTHGFELHCNPEIKPNNLQINFPDPNTGKTLAFHMLRLDNAECYNNFTPAPQPPPSGECLIISTNGSPVLGKGPGTCHDTYYGSGKGRLNPASQKPVGDAGCGAYAFWIFTDGDVVPVKNWHNAGEPGKFDRIVSLAIFNANDDLIVRWDGNLWARTTDTLVSPQEGFYPGQYLQTGNHQFLPASSPNAKVRNCSQHSLGDPLEEVRAPGTETRQIQTSFAWED